jgi:hypothetical protein
MNKSLEDSQRDITYYLEGTPVQMLVFLFEIKEAGYRYINR